MIGAGTVINPIIKVVTTVAILAAVYFFIVKPALDTTKSVSHDINHSVNRSLRQTNRQVNGAFDDLGQVQRVKVSKSIRGTRVKVPAGQIPGSSEAQLRIARCVQRVAPDTTKMQACLKLGQ